MGIIRMSAAVDRDDYIGDNHEYFYTTRKFHWNHVT